MNGVSISLFTVAFKRLRCQVVNGDHNFVVCWGRQKVDLPNNKLNSISFSREITTSLKVLVQLIVTIFFSIRNSYN